MTAEDDGVTVSIYVWLEGWDGECMNAIFNQILSTTMSFRIQDHSESL